MTDELGPDPWEERMEFGQLFIRHLAALGRPLPPDSLPPLDVAGYLEMIGLGEMIAEYDRTGAAAGFYRDPAYLHGALDAGATWAQLAGAVGDDEATTRRRYREWAADQHRLYARGTYEGLDDDEYVAAIKRAEGRIERCQAGPGHYRHAEELGRRGGRASAAYGLGSGRSLGRSRTGARHTGEYGR